MGDVLVCCDCLRPFWGITGFLTGGKAQTVDDAERGVWCRPCSEKRGWRTTTDEGEQ